MTQIVRRVSHELPDIAIDWYDDTGTLIDLSGYTFSLKIGTTASGAAVLTKTTGFTGASTSPNLTVTFAAAELDDLVASTSYICQLSAITSSKQRGFPDFTLFLTPAMT